MNKGERRDGVGGAAVGASAGGTAAMCGQVRRLVFAAGGRHTALLLRAVFPLGTVGGGGEGGWVWTTGGDAWNGVMGFERASSRLGW